jgi:hypothetical protein
MVSHVVSTDAAAVQAAHGAIAQAAASLVKDGRAQLDVTAIARVYAGDGGADTPAVVLTPLKRGAARVVIEIQRPDLWWLNAGDGPGTELPIRRALTGDIVDDARLLVDAVVAGRYSHEVCIEQSRARQGKGPVRAWSETFVTENGPVTSRHFGSRADGQATGQRTFAPY